MHNKGNYKQDKKTNLRMGQNIYKQSSGKRVNLQSIQTARGDQYLKLKKNKKK